MLVLRQILPLTVGLVLAGTSAAMAFETLYEGKTPAELFVIQCGECHKTPHGLAKGGGSLAGFLREHYTTGREQADALAAYVQGGGGGAAAARDGRAPKGAAAAAPAGEATAPGRERRTRAEPPAPADEKPPRQAHAARPAAVEPGTAAQPASGAAPAAAPDNVAAAAAAGTAAAGSGDSPSRLHRKRDARAVPSLRDPGTHGNMARVPSIEEGHAPEPAAPPARTAVPSPSSHAARYEPPGEAAANAGHGDAHAAPGEASGTPAASATAEAAAGSSATGAPKVHADPAPASPTNAAPASPAPVGVPSASTVRPDNIPD